MSKTGRWPAKMLRLLVALALVISFTAVIAPAVAAQECDPVEFFEGCHLEVFVNTYVKDDVTGDFTPVTSIDVGDCFYINAVVVNTGNESTTGNINATVDLGGISATLYACTGNEAAKVSTAACGPGELVDFWWKACCNDAGTGTIAVNVASDSCVAVNGTATLTQTVEAEEKCVEVKIIEAPGLTPDNPLSTPGWYDEPYPLSPFEQTVVPCTNFGIKAKITNNCSGVLSNVNGTISWTGPASLVGGDPNEWCVGDMDPGESAIVAWTLHCDDPGPVEIWVKAETLGCSDISADQSLDQITNYINDPWTVYQQGGGALIVEITTPHDGDKICQGDVCGENDVPIGVTVTNNGDLTVSSILILVSGNTSSTIFEVDPPTFATIDTLAPGDHEDFVFAGKCNGPGPVTIQATAEGTTAEGSIAAAPDTVSILQKRVIAGIYDYDPVTNVCNTYSVIGSFKNCSGIGLTGANKVTATIWWQGNGTIILSGPQKPVFDRCLGAGWEDFTTLNTVVVDRGGGWYSNSQQIDICNCCESRIWWQFYCYEHAPVNSYVTMSATVGSVTYADTSETVITAQEWKAHLIGGIATFLQNECGAMLQKDAFAPCQNFHVAIPVVNIGEAAAQGVVVTFSVSVANPDPADNTWDYVSISGDVVDFTFNETTGIGTATLGNIPADSMKKAVLQLHCAQEGDVDLYITGITGIDENTQAAIHQSNIEVPPCPTTVKQIPFTVTLLNPIDCQTFNQGDRFAVKALINNDSDTDLEDVSATISITGAASLVSPQSATKIIGNATDHVLDAESQAEITWEIQCTGPGEVYIYVTATSTDPSLATVSETVNVHQTYKPNVRITKLSPADYSWIATSQEFAITAMVCSTGPVAAESVVVGIDGLDRFSVVEGDNPMMLGTMAPGTSQIVTWTVHGDYTGRDECENSTDSYIVYVNTTSEQSDLGDDIDEGDLEIYPAAHLVTSIESITPASPFLVCEEFDVVYRVTNTGEADAWEVYATLSVTPEGSVRIAEGEGGYTQYLGTIAGWRGDTKDYQYKESTFTLHCKQACESTLTITPSGQDECGWFYGLMIDERFTEGAWELWIYDIADWSLEMMDPSIAPGMPIPDVFIEPVSQTVKQLESGQLDLGITKTVDDANPKVGEDVTFTIVVVNNGPTNASGVEVTDILDADLTFVSQTATQGSEASGVWSVGDLVVGGQATWTITATVDSADEITNTATITAVDQPDGAPSNDSAMVTLNEAAVTSVDIALDMDWNLISMPLIPDDSDIETLLADIEDNVDVVWAYDPSGGWTSYIPDGPPPSLTAIVDGKGYWIDMSAADTLVVDGVEIPLPPQTPPSYDVVEGWNLIGFKSTEARTAGDYTAAIAGKWTRIYGFADGMYSVIQSDDMMMPGFGYWIAVIEAGTIYP